jgi:hypothetical protein
MPPPRSSLPRLRQRLSPTVRTTQRSPGPSRPSGASVHMRCLTDAVYNGCPCVYCYDRLRPAASSCPAQRPTLPSVHEQKSCGQPHDLPNLPRQTQTQADRGRGGHGECGSERAGAAASPLGVAGGPTAHTIGSRGRSKRRGTYTVHPGSIKLQPTLPRCIFVRSLLTNMQEQRFRVHLNCHARAARASHGHDSIPLMYELCAVHSGERGDGVSYKFYLLFIPHECKSYGPRPSNLSTFFREFLFLQTSADRRTKENEERRTTNEHEQQRRTKTNNKAKRRTNNKENEHRRM